MKKVATERPPVDIEALSNDTLLPVVQAWDELLSKCGEKNAAQLFPLLARLVTSARVGPKRSRQAWNQADAEVRTWEKSQAQKQAQGPKRARGRPQGTTKHADELAPHFLTLQRLDREQAQREGRKPMSASELARLIAREVTSNALEPTPTQTGGLFMTDDGVTHAVAIVPEPQLGYFGSEAGLARRIMEETEVRRGPRPKRVKENPQKG